MNFYLPPGDPAKRQTYETFRRLSLELARDWLDSGRLVVSAVPYEGGSLPVWHMAGRSGGPGRPAVLFHLGYDSCKEELLPVMELFSAAGLDIWLFEGPGQGEALYGSGLTMTHEWERPVKAVLDHLGLADVTLVVRRAMRHDSYTRWGVEQGMFVFGVDSPWEYFETLARYSLKDISGQIRQDFLLIGSTHDHFIPEQDFVRQIRALTGVRSLTARLFTPAEGAENHVQFGNLPLVSACMIDWIKERSRQ